MSFFQLVIKQMRQRALSTWLTLLSVMLGVGLAVSIMIFRREGQQLFGQSDYGYDLIIGAKGSKLQLVLNTVYHLDVSPGNMPYGMYQEVLGQRDALVVNALPMAVGDEYNGYRVVATLPQVFPTDDQGKAIEASQVFQYRLGRQFEMGAGRAFHPLKFEAVVGSEVARNAGLGIGSVFKAQHGAADARRQGDIHDEKWTVTGILKPTQTAQDRVIFISLVSYYAIGEHEKALVEMSQLERGRPLGQTQPSTRPATGEAHEGEEHEHHAYSLNPDGTIRLNLPQSQWKIAAILVRTAGGHDNAVLAWQINNRPEAMAASPAVVMREFYDTFLRASTLLLLVVSLLVTVVAAVSILVSIYNAVSARLRENAILRALGATRRMVLQLICIEAGLVGLAGGLAGLVLGHLLGAAGSLLIARLINQSIDWLATDPTEWLYLMVVVILAAAAGLVPAMKAYRTPVATYLAAE